MRKLLGVAAILLGFSVLAAPVCGDLDDPHRSGQELLTSYYVAWCEADIRCSGELERDVSVCGVFTAEAQCALKGPAVCDRHYFVSNEDYHGCVGATRDQDCDSHRLGVRPETCWWVDLPLQL